MAIISKSAEIGGKKLTLEIGRFAPQATAAVLGSYGETMVLVTVVEAQPREDLGYFPLTVDYIERLYAGGRIKGSRWVKREGRPSDEGILLSRLVDRSVRPLFPSGYANELQIVITVLSVDLENDPDIVSVITTSAALALAGVPWKGPVGTVRVALKEKIPFINPTNTEREFSDLDLVVSATKEKVLMLEAGGKEVPEDLVLAAIAAGKKETEKIIDLILDLQKEAGVSTREIIVAPEDKEFKAQVKKIVTPERIKEIIQKNAKGKEGGNQIEILVNEAVETLGEERKKEIRSLVDKLYKEQVREMILSGERPDGRKVDEVRKIEVEVGLLPRTHGSAMFRRGQTQVLSVTTLGTPSLHQLIESAEGEEVKRYIHHYSMPPYSVGETGRIGTPSRREIGHGALAERAVEQVVPMNDKFPYTIRVVSEVLSSNGSTSMASTCGSTLSLMDAGVPIKNPVSGIAMGLVTGKDKEVILTDIAGIEDFNGDMDFKVAGTKNGITAIQLDVKIDGLTPKLIEETFAKAKIGREFILEKMLAVLASPREKISRFAPRVSVLHIEPEKIGEVIGPGGRVIRKMMEQTNTQIDIDDDGTVSVSGVDDQSVGAVISQIEGITREIKAGDVFEGTVKRIQPFGAFVEVLPGREGLVHVSQMSTEFVSDPNKIVSLGQQVKVRVSEIDEQHRINLSMLFGEDANKAPRRNNNSEGFRDKGFFPATRTGFRSSGRPGFDRSRNSR